MMDGAEEVLERLMCCSCYKYCSVKPVKVYEGRKIRCGRCSQDKDSGIISTYNKFLDIWPMPCINRFTGCNKLLHHSEVLEHEQYCKLKYVICPDCKRIIPSFMIEKHFKREHNCRILLSTNFHINLGVKTDANYYLYRQENNLFFVLYHIDINKKILCLDALLIGSSNCKVLQSFSGDIGKKTVFIDKSCRVGFYKSLNKQFNGIQIDLPTDIHEKSLLINFQLSNIDTKAFRPYKNNITYKNIFQFSTTDLDKSHNINRHSEIDAASANNLPSRSATNVNMNRSTPIPIPNDLRESTPDLILFNSPICIQTAPMPLLPVLVDTNIYSCDICGTVCKSGAGLASHKRAHERRGESSTAGTRKPTNVLPPSGGYSCDICGTVCKSGAGLASHKRAHERRGENSTARTKEPTNMFPLSSIPLSGYSCDVCGMVCTSGAGLASHKTSHERKAENTVVSRNQPTIFFVDKFPISRQNSNTSINPVSSSMSFGGYSCGICGMVCKSEESLASHKRAHEEGRGESSTPRTKVPNNVLPPSDRYSCDICGMVCKSGTGLSSHKRAHGRRGENITAGTKEPTNMFPLSSIPLSGYSCDICGMVCTSGAGLASHKRSHERRDENNVVSRNQPTISFLDSFPISRQTYNTSINSVSSSMSFGGHSCGICGMVCKSGAGLASHMRAHGRRGAF